MGLAFWLAIEVMLGALAQSPGEDRALAVGCERIETRLDAARRRDEPCQGLLLAAASFALTSAGRVERGEALALELEKRAATIVSTPARALAVLALTTRATPAGWKTRGPLVDALLHDLLRAQDLREWRTRRAMLGRRASGRQANPSYGGFGLNLSPRAAIAYDGKANVLSTTLVALAIRSAERLGTQLVPPRNGTRAADDPRAETWPALAQFVVESQDERGAIATWPGTVTSGRRSTTLGALSLALALPALAPDGFDDERRIAEVATCRAALDRALAALASMPLPEGGVDLLETAASRRLAWCCGARDLPLDVVAARDAAFPGAGEAAGSARLELALDESRGLDDVLAWYSAEPPRELLAAILDVLARSEAGKAHDVELHHTLLDRLDPARLAGKPLALLGELIAGDGVAAQTRLLRDLAAGVAWPHGLAAAAFAGRAGWDFGFAAADSDELRRRALRRAERFHYDDSAPAAGRQHAAHRFALGVRSLLGNESAEEVAGLLELDRALGAREVAKRLAELLADGDVETRLAALRFVELAGVDPGEFDAEASPSDASAARDRLVLRLAAR